ncbi:MAG: hypothetical protein QM784_08570 [Polyangiaceae bacterium]
MSNWQIRPAHALGLLAAVASLSLFISPASSQSGRDVEAGNHDQKLLSRIALLEKRLSDVEERLQTVEQNERTSRSTASAKRATPQEPRRQVDNCSSPSYLDSSGVRHVRAECIQSTAAASCEPPFVLDTEGIKRIKTDCL